jgi:hypothetical protein
MGAGLGYLWRNMTYYEKSMPSYVLDPYLSPVIEGGLPKLLVQEAAVPAKYESSQVKDQFIRGLLAQGELTYTRSALYAKEGKELYLFKAGRTTLAAVTLEKIAEGAFGRWQVAEVEIQLPIYGEMRLYVPDGAQVTVNGSRLDEGDQTAGGIPFEELDGLPQDLIEMPGQTEYRLTGLYNQPVIEALGFAGNPLPVEWREDEDVRTAVIIPTAPEEDLEALEKMALDDTHLYSNYTSHDATFGALARRLVREAEIYGNMQTMETIWYTNHVAFAFSDERVHNIRWYSPDCLAADIDYTYTISRSNGRTYPFNTAVTFYYLKLNGQWLIGDIALQQE